MEKVKNLLMKVASEGVQHLAFWWVIVGAAWAIGLATGAIEMAKS